MRYLITVSSLTPGSGLSRYVFSLCRLLAEADNEVHVLTTHDDSKISYERRELDLISQRIRLVSLGQKSKLRKYIEVIRAVHKIRPNVIINNYNAVVQYILPFISKKIKVIHVLHNDTDDFYRVASINGSKNDGWIAPTESIASHFNEYTSDRYAGKVKVIPHGVEEAKLHEKDNSTLEIIYAGVLYEHKGVKILPQIIKRLRDEGVDLHFTIVGGGILDKWLREQFSDEISAGIVTFTGIIDHDMVYDVMSRGDIFLYPTHLDAFGLVIAEAMMNGAVPVVTHLPGITDNLIPGEQYGALIPQDNIEKFVSIIAALDSDREHLKRLSENASQRAFESLSLHAMKKAYLKYLNNL